MMDPECHPSSAAPKPRALRHRADGGAMLGVPRRRTRLQANPWLVTSVAILLLSLVLSACSRSDAPDSGDVIAAAPAYESPTMPAIVTPIITPIPTATNTPTPLPTPTPDGCRQSPPNRRPRMTFSPAREGVYSFVVMEADGYIVSSYNSRTHSGDGQHVQSRARSRHPEARSSRASFRSIQEVYLDPALFDKSRGRHVLPLGACRSYKPIGELLFAVGAWSSNVNALTLLAAHHARRAQPDRA
ncbi:MAG: hypothetical protein R2855_09910 [Thermomicrobiales bacterium]